MKVFQYFEDDNKFFQFNIRDLRSGEYVALLIENEISICRVCRTWQDDENYFATVSLVKIQDNNIVEMIRDKYNLVQPIGEITCKKEDNK